jgi:hypothetical protein
MSPEAPPPVKLCAAGALIPPPDGQKNNGPDRADHEIAGHHSFRGAWQARRSCYDKDYRREKPARPERV